jgi:hypothetical protein
MEELQNFKVFHEQQEEVEPQSSRGFVLDSSNNFADAIKAQSNEKLSQYVKKPSNIRQPRNAPVVQESRFNTLNSQVVVSHQDSQRERAMNMPLSNDVPLHHF